MTPQRWSRIEQLFEAASNLPPSERSAYLDAECAGDADLRFEVDVILAADADSTKAIRNVIEDEASALDVDQRVAGRRFGPWRVTGIAGRGGMSSVYRAVRDDDRFQKRAAIKILRGGLHSEFSRARFRHERQILATLEHPNIARLIDGGEVPTGDGEPDTPYIVMEYVEGVPITDYCRDHDLSIAARLKLFLEICEAVAYAHRKLVIHRDLKPGNILVGADGAPKLLDFGIAKLQDPDLRTETLAETSTGMRLMTPEYASPEQVRGDPVSAATDVYLLGAVLFEMLTGERAHRIAKFDPLEIARVICEETVARPSLAAPERLRRQLAGDLDNIIWKAMSKEPDRRYPSVEQFSEDIRRHLAGLPVVARKDTLVYRAGKYVRRNRLPLAAAALAVAGIAVGVTSSVISGQRAQKRFEQVRKLANRFLFDFDREIRQVPGTTRAREMLVKTALEYLDSLSQDAGGDPGLQAELAQAYERVGDVQGMTGLPNLGQPAKALESYAKALAIRRALLEADPRKVDYSRGVANSLLRASFLRTATGDLDGARRAIQEGLRVAEAGLQGRQPEPADLRLVANGYLYLSYTEQNEANAPAAVDASRHGADWMQRYARVTNTLRARSDLARAYVVFGRQLLMRGDLEAARRNLLDSRSQRESIARDAPNDAENLREWETADHFLGNLHGETVGPNLHDLAAARQYYDESLALAERLLASDPQNISAHTDLVNCYGKLGDLYRDTDAERALTFYRKALNTAAGLADESSRLGFRAEWLGSLSYALRRAGRAAEARRDSEEALALTLQLHPSEPGPDGCRLVARAYRAAGIGALEAHDLAAARERLSKAVAVTEPHRVKARTHLELAVDLSRAWEDLETFHRAAGNPQEAQRLRDTRLEFWRVWNREMTSPHTQWELARAANP